MLKKLESIFPNLIINDISLRPDQQQRYEWFKMHNDKIIGIPKQDLSEKETMLLTTLLQSHNPSMPAQTPRELAWFNAIHHATTLRLEEDRHFRFVYFTTPTKQSNPSEFKKAIKQLFNQEIPILWENGHEGILVEEKGIQDEAIAYNQIIDILMSDLYIKLNFLVGSFERNLTDVSKYYQSIVEAGQLAFYYSDKSVLTYLESVPYLIMEQASISLKNQLTETVLQEFVQDKEFAHMMDEFLANNLNISLTAKKLHMHRNSLQYRLDRFISQTGIDIRLFHHASIVHLALIANKSKKLAQINK